MLGSAWGRRPDCSSDWVTSRPWPDGETFSTIVAGVFLTGLHSNRVLTLSKSSTADVSGSFVDA